MFQGFQGQEGQRGKSDRNTDTWERTSPHRERGEMATHQMFPPSELTGKLQRFVIILCPNPHLHWNVLIGGNCINTTVKCRKSNTHWSGECRGEESHSGTDSLPLQTHAAPASLRLCEWVTGSVIQCIRLDCDSLTLSSTPRAEPAPQPPEPSPGL